MNILALILGYGALALGLVLFVAYLVDAFRQDRIARAMAETGLQDAAPAPNTPAVQGSALADLRACYQRGHVYTEWARTDTHWLCVRCGDQVQRDRSWPPPNRATSSAPSANAPSR